MRQGMDMYCWYIHLGRIAQLVDQDTLMEAAAELRSLNAIKDDFSATYFHHRQFKNALLQYIRR